VRWYDDGLMICNNRILVVIKLKRFTKVKDHMSQELEWHFSEKDLPEGEGDSVGVTVPLL
jgi:hypothetical protein